MDNELSTIEAKILLYFQTNGCMNLDSAIRDLHFESVELRINELKYPKRFLNQNADEVKMKSGAIHTTYKNEYYISELGEKVLQDYREKKKLDKHNFLIKSVLTPIGVTIATTVLIHLLARILKLVFHNL